MEFFACMNLKFPCGLADRTDLLTPSPSTYPPPISLLSQGLVYLGPSYNFSPKNRVTLPSATSLILFSQEISLVIKLLCTTVLS